MTKAYETGAIIRILPIVARKFKYLDSIISEEVSRIEIISRPAHIMASVAKLE